MSDERPKAADARGGTIPGGADPSGDADASDDLFRPEAVRDYTQARIRGRLLRISPRWASWAYWVLLATVVGAAVFVSVAKVGDQTLLDAIRLGERP
jgi:hypothetical protein